MTLWLIQGAFTFGLFILSSGDLTFLPIFLLVAYPALLFVQFRTVRSWRDLFNPISLMLWMAFVRFSLPAFLVILGLISPAYIFETIGVPEQAWHLGHVLALTGLLGVMVGWFLIPVGVCHERRLRFDFMAGTWFPALCGMLLGFLSLLLFVGGNVGITGAITGGEIRGAAIQEGTGKYFYFAFILSASSVLLCGYLLARKRMPRWIALSPVVATLLCYVILGGRARAMTPVVSALLLVWYAKQEEDGRNLKFSRRIYLWVLVLGLYSIWFAHFVDLYRGGLGLAAFSQSLSASGLGAYLLQMIFWDLGHLHGLAGAIAVGGGVLKGVTFIGSLSWPFTEVLKLPGKSTGIFIVQTLLNSPNVTWGLLPSLIGDAYVNFGILGMAIVSVLFGYLLKKLYAMFRRGSLHSVIYVLAVVYSLRIFFESIDKWGEALTVLSFAFLVIKLGETLCHIHPQGDSLANTA